MLKYSSSGELLAIISMGDDRTPWSVTVGEDGLLYVGAKWDQATDHCGIQVSSRAPAGRDRRTALLQPSAALFARCRTSPWTYLCAAATSTGLPDLWSDDAAVSRDGRHQRQHGDLHAGSRVLRRGCLCLQGERREGGLERGHGGGHRRSQGRSAEATDDSYVVDEGLVLVSSPGVLASDSDPDGDMLSAVLLAAPEHGDAVLDTEGDAALHTCSRFPRHRQDDLCGLRGSLLSHAATITIEVRDSKQAADRC